MLSFWAGGISSFSPCAREYRLLRRLRLVATCHLQTCFNLLKQLATGLLMTSYNNQLATSLLTTCNRLVITSFRKPCERLLISACCNKLLQDVNRLVTTCAFLAVSTHVKISQPVASLQTSRQQVMFAQLVRFCQQLWNKAVNNL